MKKLFTLVLAACAFYSCCNNEPKQFAGFIEDATMNNVVVKELTGDQTQTFSTATADMTQANGMLLGAPIIVDYKGNLKEVTEATKVSVDATYCNAVGEWTMPDPIDSTKVMGINLMIQGDAASVNMATMVYKSWELQGPVGKLLLHGQSIGNGETIDFTENATLSEKDGKFTLAIDGTDVVYSKVGIIE